MFISSQLYKSRFMDFLGGGSEGGMQSLSPLIERIEKLTTPFV